MILSFDLDIGIGLLLCGKKAFLEKKVFPEEGEEDVDILGGAHCA